MKKIFLLLITFLFLINISQVLGVGIMYLGQDDKSMVFEPGLEKSFSFRVLGAQIIHSYVTGDLVEYVTLVDNVQDGGERVITANVKLPKTLNPGRYAIFIGARELAEPGAGVAGLAAIESKISVLTLFPGTFPEYSMSTNDVNVDENIIFDQHVKNLGTENILLAYGSVDLYNQDNTLVEQSILTNKKGILSNGETVLTATFISKGRNLRPGKYRAVSKLSYDGMELNDSKEVYFLIGKMDVNVVSSTPEIIVNATNKFSINIESEWSGDILDVYAKITTPTGKVIKTPSADLIKPGSNAKAQAVLESYFETTGLNLGMYDLPVDIHYGGVTKQVILKVNVTDGIPPIIEMPKAFDAFSIKGDKIVFLNTPMPLTLFLMICLCVLVVFNVGYFFAKSSSKNSSSKNKSNGTNTASNNESDISKNVKINPPKP